MVAYSFKRRFADPIKARTKRQTIRADRKRHARPGEELQLYTGMRTKQCALIDRATCIAVVPIAIDFVRPGIILGDGHGEIAGEEALNTFARSDGFADWPDMVAFWKAEHGKGTPLESFTGVLITWRPK